MTPPVSKPSILKNLTVGLIVTGLLFAGAEVAQRARYALRYRHHYWLLYGFVQRPADYRAHMERYNLARQAPPEPEAAPPPEGREPLRREFQAFTVQYDGYYKLRPGRFRLRAKEGVFYTVNSHGLRGRPFEVPKPPGVVRILCLGGSSTFGMLNDDDHTWPALLEGLLASGGPGRYEVVNGGFIGARLDNLEAFFAREGPGIAPDIVIVYSLFNNLIPPMAEGSAERRARGLRLWLADHSLLALTATEKVAIWRYGQGLVGTARYDFRATARQASEEATWQPFRRHLAGILDEARRQGARVLVVKQALQMDLGPWAPLFQPAELWEAHRVRARRIVDEAAQAFGSPVLDAQALFAPEGARRFFDDPVHLTDEGNARLARAISAELVKLGWASASQGPPPSRAR